MTHGSTRDTREVSVLTLNIGAAARPRAEQLLTWLVDAGHDAGHDVVLLTETSAGPGTAYLLDHFARAGYTIVNTPDHGDRGAALITRIPVLDQPVQFKTVTIPGRVAAAVLDTRPRLCVAAVYVPSRDRSTDKTDRKHRFLTSLQDALATLPDHQRDGLLLGGDYNVIARTHQPSLPGFLPFEYDFLDHLHALGLVDVHDHHHPDAPQPHSWIGRTGDGYRYDYLHLARPLAGRITGCAYLHTTRQNRLTDHAAVTATLRLDQVQRLPVQAVTADDDLALF
ncbi:endonuclease/exonuclease/phosphatase family protein [Thermomonospora cellulosilytica]|uniref:Exodeoxyribonuclease-3 n=1 Tax=Thermomonospora cellulosilytica TaxID=1411118 RepID=A0A7W3N1P6_9ACTN|nr:endonuclease/exonuclease/phosphatase family protein [Thermomonospora cellulosilytica]MBA9005931.1 exodeoxyribonuclease-3 [Thermomonospora cellulosilytica]